MAKTRSKSKPSPVAKVTKVTKAKKQQQEPEPETNTTLIPNKVTTKAISELVKFTTREQEKSTKKDSLFEEDPSKLYLTINTKKYLSSKPQFKPKVITLPHSIHPTDIRICLIIRDELVKTNEQLESLETELTKVDQILPGTVLKKDYKNFEKRRELFNQYDLFLFDDALMNLMPSLLGKIFYKSNKIPVPVRVVSGDKELSLVTLKNQVNKVLTSTWYLPPMGNIVSINIGNLNEEVEKLIDNVNKVVESFDVKTIKSFMIKTDVSPALPLYYTDNLFDEEDLAKEEDKKEDVEDEEEVDKFTSFEKGLLELGDVETVTKIIGKKLNKEQTKESKSKGKITKKKK
ncbi:Proteasome-interacting protein CIC1 [Spathaspora sp. JA1]|nr:Proteasome-interacting protein CIC1 [Spathaspora sp. JA1]